MKKSKLFVVLCLCVAALTLFTGCPDMKETWGELTNIADFDGSWVGSMGEDTGYAKDFDSALTETQESDSVYKIVMKHLIAFTYSKADGTFIKGEGSGSIISKVDGSAFTNEEKAYFQSFSETPGYKIDIKDKTVAGTYIVTSAAPKNDVTTMEKLQEAWDLPPKAKLSINSSKTSIRVSFPEYPNNPESEITTVTFAKQK